MYTRVIRISIFVLVFVILSTGFETRGDDGNESHRLKNDIMTPCSHSNVVETKLATDIDSVEAGLTSIVVPILLIPYGSSVTNAQRTTLTQGLGNVRRWFQRELPNRNVKWATLKTIHGNHTASYYLDNIWSVIPDEIEDKLGWNPWSTGNQRHIALVIGRDLMGWAGGSGTTGGTGLAILGLESLADLPQCDGNWWCTQEYWHGTAIHELGHGFTLPHDDNPDSIMNFHSNYTKKHLTAEAKATMEASLATQLKQVNWTYCGIDFQCSSIRCGGNQVGDRLWCLPSDLYPKGAMNIPNGYTCRSDSQCLSGMCQVNWNGDKVCTPHLLPLYVDPFFPDRMILELIHN